MKILFPKTLAVFCICSMSHAFVAVDAMTSLQKESPAAIQQEIARQVEAGAWDSYRVTIPIRANRAAGYWRVSRSHFRKLSSPQKVSVLSTLSKFLKSTRASGYNATINTKTNNFSDEPALPRLEIPLESLAEHVNAEFLLSPYAQEWAKKMSDDDGPNCYHTSIASIFLQWKKSRYMDPSEYKCHLKNSFVQIEKPEKWGDMVSFWDGPNSPTHGFTFMGPDRLHPDQTIVFTKNGYAQSRFLFMTYKQVENIYDPNIVRYYRPTSIAIDPEESSSSPCSSEYWEFLRNGGDREEALPELAAAIRAKDPMTLSPTNL